MRWLRDNGLSVALFALFAISVAGHALAGWQVWNAELARHGVRGIGLWAYLASGQFISSLFENWESEFLQMSAYVVLTAYLFQRGSPESRDPDEEPQDRAPETGADRADAPWPVRRGGWTRALYAHSLGLALFALFLASFALHLIGSARQAADEARLAGAPEQGLVAHLGDAQFWFESFQNWQSEFLSTAVLIVLGIFLRERGSPESKPVGAPHGQTGAE